MSCHLMETDKVRGQIIASLQAETDRRKIARYNLFDIFLKMLDYTGSPLYMIEGSSGLIESVAKLEAKSFLSRNNEYVQITTFRLRLQTARTVTDHQINCLQEFANKLL